MGGRLPALLLCLAAGCHAPEQAVDPAHFEEFFVWPGVTPEQTPRRARVLYLLDGEVRHRDPSRLIRLRQPPHIADAAVWLTVRVERLDWDEAVHMQVLEDVRSWEAAGTRLKGVQIDFDAATRGLGDYARFLADLRRRLPQRYRLSVTGLLDWSANGDPGQWAQLVGIVDEVVVQTYQGRRTIPGYERYLWAIERVPLPYKIALVEGGDWREPASLRRDPDFRGYVIFLLRR